MKTPDHPCLETEDRSTVRSFSNAGEALDDATIGELSSTEISQMACDEMLWMIRAARLPLFPVANERRLELLDRKTLERLVYLARRCCHNRMSISQGP